MSVTTDSDTSAYGEVVADEIARWPEAGFGLLDELTRARGRVALIVGSEAATDMIVDRLRDDLQLGVASLGHTLCERQQAPSISEIQAALDVATVLTDIELLFSPALHLPVLAFLANRSQQRPTIAVWPGDVAAGRATYSTPGKPDFQGTALNDAVIIYPRPTRFPDEVPFEIERILR